MNSNRQQAHARGSIKQFDLRSDHLKAAINYALEQAISSQIHVLDFGDNENALDYEEAVQWLQDAKRLLEQVTASGNCDLLIRPVVDSDLVETDHGYIVPQD